MLCFDSIVLLHQRGFLCVFARFFGHLQVQRFVGCVFCRLSLPRVYPCHMRKLKNEELNRISVEEFKNKKKNPLVIVMDNVRSMNNVGSAFRTADAFSIDHIYLCGITARPPHREITKTALGATESVDWTYCEQTTDCLQYLKQQGYCVVLVEQTDSSIMLQDFRPESKQKYAFVFGNEAFGISDEALAYADQSLEIPQHGTKHSINISVCLGITVWDFLSKRGLN